jgi:hypothetical protein
LSAFAAGFEHIHDAPEIVRRLHASPPEPLPASILERTAHLLTVRRHTTDDQVQAFEIDAATASLLDYLRAPRSMAEIGRRMDELGMSAVTGERLLDQLLELGALVSASSPARSRRALPARPPAEPRPRAAAPSPASPRPPRRRLPLHPRSGV